MNPGPKVVAYLFGNQNLPVTDTLIVSWVSVVLLIIIAKIGTSNLKLVPGKLQNSLEILVEAIHDQIEPMLPGEGWKYLPFIATIFLYVGVGNLIGLVPIPGNTSPTGDLNMTLALALIVFIVSNYAAIKEAGLWNYLKGFVEPMFFLLPINLIGELAKPISHSFRLFGNVVGGGIIITLVYQAFPWLIPLPFHGWFDIFVGLIQTLIFGTIAIAYIAVAKD
ncbi:MAG: F0F1 ATP synthase subunit A [Halanaerobiaceae bacterium]